VLFVVGCSDDDKVRRLPDAPPPPDGTDVDASTSGPVALTIFVGLTPQEGVRVIFQNADNTVVSDTMTGADGKATATMAPGGFVTAIDPFPGRAKPSGAPSGADIRTFSGVKPGDQLRLFERDFSQNAISMNFILPIDPNASEYYVSTNCATSSIFGTGSGGPPQVQLFMQGCGQTSNLLVETGEAGALVSQIYKTSIALMDGGTIDLTADAYAAVPDVTFTYSNVPAGITGLSVEGVRSTSLGPIKQFSNGVSVTGGTATFSLDVPNVPNAQATTVTSFYGPTFTTHLVADWGPAAATYALDPTGLFLPEFDGPATIDAAAHAIKWSTTGGSAQPDFVRVRANFSRDLGGKSSMFWRWEIVAPAGTQAVFPKLPDASPYNIMAGDFGGFDVAAAKVPGGYDAVRANVLAIGGPTDLTVGASGTASLAFLVEIAARKQPGKTSVLRGITQTRR
jgi:hypothetical protein